MLLSLALGLQSSYDPVKISAYQPTSKDLSVHDNQRNRDIPVRVYLPESKSPAPVVLFSHGLGGSREGNRFTSAHWASRGYVVVVVQHPGSDDSVWKGTRLAGRMAAMKAAVSSKNFLLRVRDIPAVIDQLTKWTGDSRHSLSGRIDITRLGMSGHSFGAVTTQAVSGQSYGPLGTAYTDSRIKAALAFSPNNPTPTGGDHTFGSVKIPWLLMTGTKDTAAIGGATVESRLGVYPNLPKSIDSYELVLFDAEHSAFTDRALPGDREPRNPNHHKVILALSTAFWDAYLRGDAAAKAWLRGPGAKSILEPKDRWQISVKH